MQLSLSHDVERLNVSFPSLLSLEKSGSSCTKCYKIRLISASMNGRKGVQLFSFDAKKSKSSEPPLRRVFSRQGESSFHFKNLLPHFSWHQAVI